MTQRKECLESDPGLYLGIVKSYMVYGLKNVPFALPRKVLPSALSIPEPVASVPRDKKGGKIPKQRKHRGRRDVKKIEDNEESAVDLLPDISCVSISKLKTSDSDFSDTEGGRKAKLGITEGRVRQAALNFLLAIINVSGLKENNRNSYKYSHTVRILSGLANHDDCKNVFQNLGILMPCQCIFLVK